MSAIYHVSCHHWPEERELTDGLLELVDFGLELLLRHPRVLRVLVVLQPQLVLALRLRLVHLLLQVEHQTVLLLQFSLGDLGLKEKGWSRLFCFWSQIFLL